MIGTHSGHIMVYKDEKILMELTENSAVLNICQIGRVAYFLYSIYVHCNYYSATNLSFYYKAVSFLKYTELDLLEIICQFDVIHTNIISLN